jgi:micrococcal nuclease
VTIPRIVQALLACGWLLLATAAQSQSLADSPICTAAAQPVQISHVIDGDTVVLADGERVRLIGIDTPELGRRGQPHEYGAIAAREALRSLLANATRISARIGNETRDRYDRLLAHLYADGRNVQAILLEDGLAVPLIIPPNIHHIDCYELATASARAERRGLWPHPDYRVRDVGELDFNTRGYQIVSGRVQRIGHSRTAVWINLTNDFALRITRDDLDYFDGVDFDALIGKEIEARGFIYERNNQLRMRIRHPVDMRPRNAKSGEQTFREGEG